MRLLTVLFCFGLLASALGDVKWGAYRSEKAGVWSARAVYPVFSGDSEIVRVANKESAGVAKLVYDAFLRVARTNPQRWKYEFDYKPTVGIVHEGLISWYWQHFEFTGGAHPNTYYRSVTVGVVNGKAKPLVADDVVLPGKRDALMTLLERKLREAKRARGVENSGSIDPGYANHFVVTPSGMTWLLEPYAAGPYVEGSYFLKCSWMDLDGIVDKSGLLRHAISGDAEMMSSKFLRLAGNVMYRERIAMPMGANVEFRLLSKNDDAQPTLHEAVTMSAKNPPMPFRVEFDRSKLDKDRLYWLDVVVRRADGSMMFRSELTEVPYTGWESAREILVKMVGPAALEGVEWRMYELNGKAVSGAHVMLLNGSFTGKSFVNRFSGKYTATTTTLELDPGMMTMMAGTPEQMKLEREFLDTMKKVNGYKVSGRELHFMEGEKIVARFRG